MSPEYFFAEGGIIKQIVGGDVLTFERGKGWQFCICDCDDFSDFELVIIDLCAL